MAARLMWRASRLLAVPVSFQPSVPSECVRLCQLVPSLPLQAPLHTSPLCRQVESVPKISENPENSENTGEDAFFSMLNGLPGIEEVLSVVESQKLDVNKCVMVIIQLAKRRAENFPYLHDRRFIKLLEKINKQVHSIWNGRLIRLLKNLYLLGLDNKNHCYKSVEIEVRWRLRKLSMASLGQLASYVARQPQNPESKLLLEDVAKEVELRGTEITDTLTLSLLISSLGVLPENLMERLEDKVLEFALQFKPNESRRILLAMAFQNRRSLPVLRALSHTLAQERLAFSTGVLVDVAFSLARLNFSQVPLFNKLCQDFVSLMPKISPSDSTMFLRSIGLLRFPYPPVCEAVAQAFLDGKEFSSIHLCSIILSFARFNFLPSQSEQFFNLVHKKLLPSFDLLPWSKRVELVWSLCILGQATPSFLLKILDSEQVKTLSGNTDYLRSSICFKLLNINATAILESPDHWGFLLPDDLIRTILTVNHGFPTTSMQKNIRDVLKMVFPDPETCNLNVKTTYGWTLDADVILDSNYNPLPLKKFVAPHLPVSEGTEPLPEDARRFAVVAREFSHYLVSRKDLLGMFLMFQRQMRAAGFLVVEVPYYEWVELKSDFQKQSYLKDQFRKVVAQEMAQLEA